MVKKRKVLSKYLLLILALVSFFIILFPIYWMINCSFQENARLYVMPPNWFPSDIVVDNFIEIITDGYFVRYFFNSMHVSLGAMLITALGSISCGYAFSRFKYKINGFLMSVMLATSMFPVVSQLISIYITFRRFGLLNTHFGLMLVTTSISIPFTILMIKGFFDDVPISLEEAARIDGCGRFSILFRISIPLVKPGILAICIYSFMRAWNDYQYALTLITKDELRTIGPGISIRYTGEVAYKWGNTLAVAVCASIPILIIFMFLQKYMVTGLTSGAVKG